MEISARPAAKTTLGIPLTVRSAITVSLLSAAYILLSAVLIGYKTDQLFLVLFFNVFFYLSATTRRFIVGFSVFIVFWILFDFMKAFPNYNYRAVHIESIYQAEKTLFGIGGLTPNEFWRAHTSVFLDVAAGCFYLCWIPLPLAFAGYLFYKDKELFFRFALTFLLVNLLGFIVYYGYPAAPPWYVQQYGFDFHAHTPGNTAGLGRFDQYFHVSIFSSLYAKSSNVFAAMPSLHAAYPLTVLYYGIRSRTGWFNAVFALIMAGIWFAAVYSSHHYILDVLAGITCGITGITLFNYLFANIGWVTRFVQAAVRKISAPSRTPERSFITDRSPRP